MNDSTATEGVEITREALHTRSITIAGYRRSDGLRMSRGWAAEVKRRLSGAASCVHLAGLMVPMATTAFRSMTLHRLQQAEPMQGGTPSKIDSCMAYSRRGDLVKRRWPTFYIAKAHQA